MIRKGSFDSSEFTDWIMEEAPTVHVDFVLWFLRSCKEDSPICVSKRLLSEGSKKMDPSGLVADRDQYKMFTELLKRWLMVTQSFGDQPPMWIPPWTPETAAKSLGVWHMMKPEEEKE